MKATRDYSALKLSKHRRSATSTFDGFRSAHLDSVHATRLRR